MKYFLIAGEASGDLHGADVVSEIRGLDKDAQIVGMGGDKMKSAGTKLIVSYKEYSFMGFVEVLFNLRKIKKLFTIVKQSILDNKPDRVVLIDYGGFNLKIAKFCHELSIPTHFYILPKTWAWNEKRVLKIKKYVDKGYCIFPFEEEYFKGHGINASYVGNPVQHQIQEYLSNRKDTTRIEKQIALLPGSRKQEIERITPRMLEFAKTRKDLSFVLAAHDREAYGTFTFPHNVRFSDKSTYDIVAESQAAIVTSGTANLETALLNTPQVVVYVANSISYAIGKRLVRLKYISPVNLIMDKLVIKELIQDDYNIVTLESEVNRLLDTKTSKMMTSNYQELKTILGNNSAAHEVAKSITEQK